MKSGKFSLSLREFRVCALSQRKTNKKVIDSAAITQFVSNKLLNDKAKRNGRSLIRRKVAEGRTAQMEVGFQNLEQCGGHVELKLGQY